MKRGGPLKRTARLRPFSKKRKDELPERRALVVRKLVAAHWRCQGEAYNVIHVCWGPLDVHEIIPRSAWREGYLVDENCVVICRGLHDWIGDHEAEAHAHGLHGYSWERP